MRTEPAFVSWTIQCISPENCRSVADILAQEASLDHVLVEKVSHFPKGIPVVQQRNYRVGDYFQDIQITPAADNSTSLVLSFHRLPDAGREWKDVMARILQVIRKDIPVISISRI